MFFSEFLINIPSLKKLTPGGLNAQFKLAPTYRKMYDLEIVKANNPTLAAVLILFFENSEKQTSFVLTERANYNGHHAKQISFPGGKKEQQDTDLIATAIRETNEEIGLNVQSTDVFKELTEVYIPPSNFLAHPYIAVLEGKPEFRMNYEVESILTPTLSALLDENNKHTREVRIATGKKIETPCFVFDNQIVWGATAMILSELRELLQKVVSN